MPVTVRNTDILFNDGTTQATKADFAAGTIMMFAQTNAPTGWTKNTSSGNQHAIRVVTGAASSGGSVDFTTAFASQTPTGTVSVSGSAGATTLTTPQIPAHNHTQRESVFTSYGVNRKNFVNSNNRNATNQVNTPLTTANSGGGGSHSHPLTISSASFSGSAINLAVRYIDVIRATKD